MRDLAPKLLTPLAGTRPRGPKSLSKPSVCRRWTIAIFVGMVASNIPDFTTCVAVDGHCAKQLEGVWPTWKLHRPEIFQRPFLAICDWAVGDERFWQRRLRFLNHPDWRIAGWSWPDTDDSEFAGMTQRERMLTAWVKVPPAAVETPYFLKLDCDVVATKTCDWILPKWFSEKPAIIASPWGYTKPAHWLHDLDKWAMTIPALVPLRALDLPPPEPDQGTIRYKRIASWCCFIDTTFAQTVADYVPGRLPVPSQDTYHWYVAWRQNETIVKTRMHKLGWSTISSDRRRKRLIAEVLRSVEEEGCCG